MTEYSATDLIRLAKRNGNSKRPFLIVNPLQAKHIPVSPSKAWGMMVAIAGSISLERKSTTVVAFAETATAIGAVVANALDGRSFYIHSTRAIAPDGMPCIDFEESHSHAVDHRIFARDFIEKLPRSHNLVFVDDEYSTGNTLINICSAVESAVDCNHLDKYAVSAVSRIEQGNLEKLSSRGITMGQLLKLPTGDLAKRAEEIYGRDVARADLSYFIEPEMMDVRGKVPDPRKGVVVEEYLTSLRDLAHLVLRSMNHRVGREARIAVVGTEECMFPSLVVGRLLEEVGYQVVCHSSTRSPICISNENGYPLQNGYSFDSPYEQGRQTYIYNVRDYDEVIILSDASLENGDCRGLVAALAEGGCNSFLWVML